MTTLDRQVQHRLKDRDVRYTRARRAVVEALAQAGGPRSAAELHADIGPAVPLSSLYRSIATLEQAGVLTPHHGARSLTRYELAEWLAGHHHHLVCTSCGSVEDIDIPADQEAMVRRLVDAIAADADFTAASHALEIEGLCGRCR